MASLSPDMIKALEITGLDDLMASGPTRAALIRRGLVRGQSGGPFGYFTPAGRELAAALQKAKRQANRPAPRPLPVDYPNHNYKAACTVAVTFACSGQGIERLNPLAMLPDSTVPNRYSCICQACYDCLALIYARSAS